MLAAASIFSHVV